ncbi:SDR family oxidoreductase [Bacillus sp. FJAT-45350]|uniref:SDR family oxidoreductase n=1 Tax=Bacillus sp. FJAT-45350 TaxID=2011014 RepID=UPI000BB84298|nr:SDR family oxidoreductase [Bacillus sp. FJAT-45350]
MNIFLTGGTGFLGTQLIQQLLDSNHHVYVLARSLKKSRELLDKIPVHLHSKIEIIEGNLSSNTLGMSVEDHARLHGKIDVFYHIAALLSFDFKKSEELYQSNQIGTKHTLEFAKSIGVKSYYYISTAYTLGKKDRADEILHPIDQEFNNSYEETKCKAEYLVMSYSESMKVAIFRPSIIVGHSVTGRTDSMFGLYGFLKGIEVFKKKMAKVESNRNKTFTIIGNPYGTQNLVPVDYVCKVLMAGLEHATNQTIYHITNPHPPINHEGFQVIKSVLDLPNIEFDLIDSGKLSKEEVLLNSFISNFSIYINRNIDFTITNTTMLLDTVNEKVLDMNEEMFKTIISGYKNERTAVLQ